MQKTYDHKTKEPEIYKLWQENDLFSPEGASKVRVSVKKPYTCLMPPPNANAALHCGHATYAIQDLMIRFKRMQGFDSLYLPGTDHAGFETQYVYERKLKTEGKSRFDFDREDFYNQVLEFVKSNADMATSQLKKLGMSADWNRSTFMLDKKVIDTVYDTFIKMHKDGLVYKSGYMVNYSTFHGTTFSDLETEYKDTVSPLYYVKYKIVDEGNVISANEGNHSEGYITVATVRPETIYADVAIAIHPKDKRMREFVGKYVINPLTGTKMPIIEDDYVDPEFGTGALKITPGHDQNDYKIGLKHGLEIISLINLDGKMNSNAKDCEGLFAKQARTKVAGILRELNAIEKIDEKYENRVLVDYKDSTPIEPMILPNWFVDTNKLFAPVMKAIETEEVKFYRSMWKKEALRWVKEKKPWPISRQTVFGIRIPVWYSINDNPDMVVTFLDQKKAYQTGKISDILGEYKLEEIQAGLQKVVTTADAKYTVSIESPGLEFLPETDTFDTWFSSGQWPLTTTGYPGGADFKKYYPTDFLDTAYEILFFWVVRMIMFSKYLTNDIPFKNVYIHGLVTDDKGKKMSKSKGNTINPLEVVDEFGADPLRFAILVGGDTSARLTPLDLSKVKGYRNFANKIWNIARYIESKDAETATRHPDPDDSGEGSSAAFTTIQAGLPIDFSELTGEDKEILVKLNTLIESVTKNLEEFKFKLAGEELYHFIWDDLANGYLESIKNRVDNSAYITLKYCFVNSLKLLHPFMPFITEAVWQELNSHPELREGPSTSDSEPYLITAKWPVVRKF